MSFLVENQFLLRLGFSLGGLLLFWSLGRLFPFRTSPVFENLKRTSINLFFSFGNGLLLFLVTPFALFELASSERLQHFSLPGLPVESEPSLFLTGFIILDFVIYWQHRLTHRIPVLWKIHRFHHSDIEFDSTTAGRFHFIEILMSFSLKAGVIILFAIPAPTVIVFEILLNFCALFNHANFHLPDKIEVPLRWLLVTPDVHRIHHSTDGYEMNKNFGFSISLWDRIFNSYLDEPKEDPKQMLIGLSDFRTPVEQSVPALLKLPFLKK